MRHNQRHKNLRRKKKIYKKNITVVIFLKNPQNQINNKKKTKPKNCVRLQAGKGKGKGKKKEERKKICLGKSTNIFMEVLHKGLCNHKG